MFKTERLTTKQLCAPSVLVLKNQDQRAYGILKGRTSGCKKEKKKKPFWDLKEKVKKGDVCVLICACECLAGSPAALNETAAEEFY